MRFISRTREKKKKKEKGKRLGAGCVLLRPQVRRRKASWDSRKRYDTGRDLGRTMI